MIHEEEAGSISAHLGKIPPQAVDIEIAVLGALMLEKDTFIHVSNILTAEHFYKDSHKEIYKAIQALFEERNPIDIKTVTHKLRSRGVIEMIGGAHYVAELTTRVNSASNIEYHARIIYENAIRRELIGLSSKIQGLAYEDTNDVFKLLNETSSDLLKINTFQSSTESVAEMVLPAIEEIQENKKKRREGKFSGVRTGLVALDNKIGGLQNGDLVIVAARPGMGKTAFVNTLLLNIGSEQKIPIGFLSMEMTSRQTVMRELSIVSEVGVNQMINGNISDLEFEKITHLGSKLLDSQIYIDDTPALSPYQIRSKALAWKMKHDIKALFFDYIQIGGSDGKTSSKEELVSKISGSLKAVAKELQIPVVALSQLNRATETRKGTDYRPRLSDLRDSGSIEQDADMVLFLHRPEYYGLLQDENGTSTKDKGEIIIEKYRNGKPDSSWFKFVGARAMWDDLYLEPEGLFAQKEDDEKDDLPF